MRVLITGGAGFIGSHLVEAYLERGDEVYIIDDLSTGSLENIEFLQKDERFGDRLFVHIDTILNHETMLELVGICDIVFHLAAAVGVQYILDNPLTSIKTNIQGTEKVLELCGKFKKRCSSHLLRKFTASIPMRRWSKPTILCMGLPANSGGAMPRQSLWMNLPPWHTTAPQVSR